MFEYRHMAINLITGEMMNAERGNHLKREVAQAERFNREVYNTKGQWRWCHDFGKKWETEGFPWEK
jgi:hypothetical protein